MGPENSPAEAFFETELPVRSPWLLHINKEGVKKCELIACEDSKLKPWQYLHLSTKNSFSFNAACILVSYLPNLCLTNLSIQLHSSPNTIFSLTEHQPFAAPAHLLFCSAIRDAVWCQSHSAPALMLPGHQNRSCTFLGAEFDRLTTYYW